MYNILAKERTVVTARAFCTYARLNNLNDYRQWLTLHGRVVLELVFLSSLINYFDMAALVPKLWVLQQCAIFQSMSLFGCMKLQLTSAKVINNLADSDCKYYYLKDSLPCKCALNGAYKMGGPGSASIPNFAWVSWEAHYCTSWELKRIPLSEHTQTASPSYTTHIKVSCFNKTFVIHSRERCYA